MINLKFFPSRQVAWYTVRLFLTRSLAVEWGNRGIRMNAIAPGPFESQMMAATLNAFRVVFGEMARAEAAQADARRRSGDQRPLLGIPLAIKDDTDIAGEITVRQSLLFS